MTWEEKNAPILAGISLSPPFAQTYTITAAMAILDNV